MALQHLKFVAFIAMLAVSSRVLATEFKSLESCDESWRIKARDGATLEAAAEESRDKGAVKVALPSPKIRGKIPNCGFYVPKEKRGDYWNGTDGIAFKIKGVGDEKWGTVSILHNENKYFRFYATFPVVKGEWTEVIIPWREFYQRNFDGRMEEKLGEIFAVWFTLPASVDAGYPLQRYPAQEYILDDIRLVTGLPKLEMSADSGSVEKALKKLKSKQAVKIVVTGASITWGLKTKNPEKDCYAARLEAKLRKEYAYDDITVVNHAVGGFSTYQAGCNLGRWVFDEEPVDLYVIGGDPSYNSYSDAKNHPDGLAQEQSNLEHYIEAVIRRGSSELIYVVNCLHLDKDTSTRNDALAEMCRDTAKKYNLIVVDTYADFQTHDPAWLWKNYYTANGDGVHFTEKGMQRAAELILLAIQNK